jgi:hypothetical protein
LDWWSKQGSAFQLFVSDEVVRELSNPTFAAAKRSKALRMLRGLGVLELTEEVTALAELLVRE